MSGAQLRALVDQAARWHDDASTNDSSESALRFRVVDMESLAVDVADEQAWIWADYIPAGHVTLLGGHGGAGKSTMAAQIGAGVSVGAEVFGRATTRTKVLFFSAEDPARLVLRRLRHICHRLGYAFDEVQKLLQVLDASDLEPVLFSERRIDGTRHGVTTETYRQLAEYVRRENFGLLIVDNASDAFDGDEINRAMVRGFIRCLAQLAWANNGAVLLLAHVDKSTSRAGKLAGAEAYSGSTAWHNSVRSRLFLLENEPGELELHHQKSNLGPKLPPLRIAWPTGDVMQVLQPGGFVAGIESRNDMTALLGLLHEFIQRGESVSTATTSRTNAALLLRSEKGFPGHLKAHEVFDLLRQAERKQLICRETHRGPDRKPRERWALTPAGLLQINAAATAATHEVTAPAAIGAATAATSQGGMGGARSQAFDRMGLAVSGTCRS